MLTLEQHPVSWSLLLYELSDATDHLGTLVSEMSEAGEIDEHDFAVQLGHVYAHLNRVWNCRANAQFDQLSANDYNQASKFPSDLNPLG